MGSQLRRWYRRPTNLGQYIEASQNYQADLLAEYTKGLRLSPRAIGGYFQFHFIDVMPANWPKSIVSHDLRPKKAYYEMAQVNQPLVPLFQLLDQGKAMELWVANDLPERFDHCRLQWSVKLGKPLLHGEKAVDVPAADAVMVEKIDISSVPANLDNIVTIELVLNDASGKTLSRYQREIFLKAWRDPEYVTKQTLCAYVDAMSAPKPFVVRSGKEFQTHRDEIRRRVLECLSLSPLPERVPLDVHQGEPLDHPWCTVRRVTYQIWPNVYTDALLYMPKHFIERPAPAILSTCGHWPDGVAYQDEQRRALNFTRLGYVVLAPVQNHYEDLNIGVSHQTLIVWNNMRALDLLESLPEVDRSRIGVAGGSGGGLQSEMLVGLGFPREGRHHPRDVLRLPPDHLLPINNHCSCNHYPGVMRFTDGPEISTLGLPAAVQYLTMNDWTFTFRQDNLPTIQKLYAANGVPDRVDCRYYNTPHIYDKAKREATYEWMERWLHGRPAGPVKEPDDSKPFPVKTIQSLTMKVPGNKRISEDAGLIGLVWGGIFPRSVGFSAGDGTIKRLRLPVRPSGAATATG